MKRIVALALLSLAACGTAGGEVVSGENVRVERAYEPAYHLMRFEGTQYNPGDGRHWVVVRAVGIAKNGLDLQGDSWELAVEDARLTPQLVMCRDLGEIESPLPFEIPCLAYFSVPSGAVPQSVEILGVVHPIELTQPRAGE